MHGARGRCGVARGHGLRRRRGGGAGRRDARPGCRRGGVHRETSDRAVQPLAGGLVGARESMLAAQAVRLAQVRAARRRSVDLPVARREPARALRAEQRAAVRPWRRA
ncbi:hypothetical protein BLAT2472_20443 [Burkholderia latens]